MDESTSTAGKKKIVGFILPIPRRKPVNCPFVEEIDLSSASPDLSRTAYFALIRMFHPKYRYKGNVKFNFQPGVTRGYIEFLLNYDWSKEDLTDEERSLRSDSKAPKLIFLDSGADLSTLNIEDQTTYLIVVENAQAEDIEYIMVEYRQSPRVHFLMLGDVWTLLQMANNTELASLLPYNVLLFGVTSFDRTRDIKYCKDYGPYPIFYEATKNNLDSLKVWQLNSRARKVFHKLFVWSSLPYPVSELCKVKSVPLKYLAPACGFFLIHTSMLQSAGHMTIDNNFDSSQLIFPITLKTLYRRDYPHAVMVPTNLSKRWQFMEEAIAKGFSLLQGLSECQTFGERYEFLRTSFVANLKDTIRKTAIGPRVVHGGLPVDTILPKLEDLTEMHKENWPELLDVLDESQIVVSPDMSHSPDVYAKLVDKSDPNKPVYHLLCFQANQRKQDLNVFSVLDELAKCPFVSTVERRHGRYKLAFESTQRSRRHREPVTYRLTFVYVATKHTSVRTQIFQQKVFDEIKPDYIRCTSAHFPAIPDNVELIVLKKKGLIDLFGKEIYRHLKWTGSALARPDVNPVPTSLPTPVPNFKDSMDRETVMREIRNFARQYKYFKVAKLELEPKGPNNNTSRSGSNDETKEMEVNYEKEEKGKSTPAPLSTIKSSTAKPSPTATTKRPEPKRSYGAPKQPVKNKVEAETVSRPANTNVKNPAPTVVSSPKVSATSLSKSPVKDLSSKKATVSS